MEINFQKKYSLKSNKMGFSMIETFVAITILLTAVVAPLSLAQRGLSSARFAKSQMTAFFLAQEGIEFIRNTRDNNRLSGEPDWLEGISSCIGVGKKCTVDSFGAGGSGVINTCTENCPQLVFYPESEIYGYSSTIPGEEYETSAFTREVEVDTVANNPDEVSITVRVFWKRVLSIKEVVIRENLLDWE